MKLICFFVITCLLGVPHARANDSNQTPLDKYRSSTESGLGLCSAIFSIQSKLADDGQPMKDNTAQCITTVKAKAVTNFKAAILTVKKDKAQEALKTYHVAFISAIEGITPGLDEPRIIYQQRQQALAGKVTEAWSRFEIEE
jgi:hypothetical protein